MFAEDSEEKIIADWNQTWSKPPLKMESMLADNLGDIYRKVLKYTKVTGKQNNRVRARQSMDSSAPHEVKAGAPFGFPWTTRQLLSSRKKEAIDYRVMVAFRHRIRDLRKRRRSTP